MYVYVSDRQNSFYSYTGAAEHQAICSDITANYDAQEI